MSEPRKLNTGAAHGTSAAPQAGTAGRSIHMPSGAPQPAYGQPAAAYNGSAGAAPQAPSAPAADPYEQARRSAQAAADQTTRLRRIQQGARPRGNTGELTPAQRQAIAMRGASRQQAGAPRAAAGQARPRTVEQPVRPAAAPAPRAEQEIRRQQPAAPQQSAPRTLHQPRPAAEAAAVQPAAHHAFAEQRRVNTAPGQRPAAAKAAPAGKNGGGSKPPKPPKGKAAKGEKAGGNAKNAKNGKKAKKRLRWWQVALITLLLIALILGGAVALIMHAIAPSGGGLTLDHMFNTPKEFQGKELNFLMVGIDRSMEDPDEPDKDVGDGNTDMILYVHFNNETGEMKMLQIPRDYMVTTNRSVSRNYKLNNVAMTQAQTSGTLNMTALMEQVSNMFQVPIDGYVSIRMEMLVELVDAFGFIELYVPQDLEYRGSRLEKGYRLLTGEQVEFLLRDRHSYADSDIGRLNTQRQFYSALFRRLKSMTVWEIAKVAPVVLNYMETDLNIGQLTSFAVSLLRMDSSKIMICQMPVYMMGSRYYWDGSGTYETNAQSVAYPARQQAADLLNTYFRENTGPVDAGALQLCEPTSDALGAFGVKSEMSLTDPNVQFMKEINDQQADAAINDNPDGLSYITYKDPETEPTPDPNAGAASQPAA